MVRLKVGRDAHTWVEGHMKERARVEGRMVKGALCEGSLVYHCTTIKTMQAEQSRRTTPLRGKKSVPRAVFDL